MSDFKKRVAVGECICNSMKVLQDKTVLVKIVQVNTGLIANTNTTYYEAFLLALNQVLVFYVHTHRQQQKVARNYLQKIILLPAELVKETRIDILTHQRMAWFYTWSCDPDFVCRHTKQL